MIKHYALENPFTDRSFKGLKKLYPFSSKNYINTSIDDISKQETFSIPKIMRQEKLALPIAQFLHSAIYTLVLNHQKKGNYLTKTFKLKLYNQSYALDTIFHIPEDDKPSFLGLVMKNYIYKMKVYEFLNTNNSAYECG